MAPRGRTPTRRGAAAALAGLAAAAAVGTVGVHRIAVGTAAGQRWDDRAARVGAPVGDAAAAEATQRLLDTISVASLALLGLGIMLIALMRGRPLLAAGAGVAVLGANVTTQLVKARVDRPDLVAGTGGDPGAFPSGHATVAMSLATALVLVSPPFLRASSALVGWAYAIAVGFAVVALGWHRPSEVLGAYGVAVAWAALVAAALALAGRAGVAAGGDARRARAGGRLAAALGLAFGVVVAVALGRRADLLRVADDRTALTLAGILCAATGALLVGALTRLLGRVPAGPASRRPARGA
ncbi:phosphatase PAP2 family protein [Miltoncostaea marina]|uniref:phosphatase PAP2 family protein n=1 Tax=Miltoncostaea marina TaxID=2843215 RepID=UPI001C3E70EA|nr:phosphatase PAP2 family protein [Miltoncostaea marina]